MTIRPMVPGCGSSKGLTGVMVAVLMSIPMVFLVVFLLLLVVVVVVVTAAEVEVMVVEGGEAEKGGEAEQWNLRSTTRREKYQPPRK